MHRVLRQRQRCKLTLASFQRFQSDVGVTTGSERRRQPIARRAQLAFKPRLTLELLFQLPGKLPRFAIERRRAVAQLPVLALGAAEGSALRFELGLHAANLGAGFGRSELKVRQPCLPACARSPARLVLRGGDCLSGSRVRLLGTGELALRLRSLPGQG